MRTDQLPRIEPVLLAVAMLAYWDNSYFSDCFFVFFNFRGCLIVDGVKSGPEPCLPSRRVALY